MKFIGVTGDYFYDLPLENVIGKIKNSHVEANKLRFTLNVSTDIALPTRQCEQR